MNGDKREVDGGWVEGRWDEETGGEEEGKTVVSILNKKIMKKKVSSTFKDVFTTAATSEWLCPLGLSAATQVSLGNRELPEA